MTSADPNLSTEIHAAAKINLFLNITGKRDDGFHLLDSGVVFTAFGDQIFIERASRDKICIAGPFAEGLKNDANKNICSI